MHTSGSAEQVPDVDGTRDAVFADVDIAVRDLTTSYVLSSKT